jgi:hypothetical protein
MRGLNTTSKCRIEGASLEGLTALGGVVINELPRKSARGR